MWSIQSFIPAKESLSAKAEWESQFRFEKHLLLAFSIAALSLVSNSQSKIANNQ